MSWRRHYVISLLFSRNSEYFFFLFVDGWRSCAINNFIVKRRDNQKSSVYEHCTRVLLQWLVFEHVLFNLWIGTVIAWLVWQQSFGDCTYEAHVSDMCLNTLKSHHNEVASFMIITSLYWKVHFKSIFLVLYILQEYLLFTFLKPIFHYTVTGFAISRFECILHFFFCSSLAAIASATV